MITEGDVVRTMKLWPFRKQAFVWAMGCSGRRVADLLAGFSIPVALFSSGSGGRVEDRGEETAETRTRVSVVPGEEVLRVDGHFGQFRIRIREKGGGVTECEAGVVLVVREHAFPDTRGTEISLPQENCMATEKLWDAMVRLSTAFGATGLASYAISAVDCALWDLKGKLLRRPVYELLGGPQKERIFCYASGFDQEWYMELGFKATKLFSPYGPEQGLDGLHRLEELVATTREQVGDHVELMLDAWTGLDVEYTVRLAEMLRPYRLKWIEDYIPADDLVGYEAVRQRQASQ